MEAIQNLSRVLVAATMEKLIVEADCRKPIPVISGRSQEADTSRSYCLFVES